jgi:hypothetical protein
MPLNRTSFDNMWESSTPPSTTPMITLQTLVLGQLDGDFPFGLAGLGTPLSTLYARINDVGKGARSQVGHGEDLLLH